MEHLYHCARSLAVLISLWSWSLEYPIVCVDALQVDLNWIPLQVKTNLCLLDLQRRWRRRRRRVSSLLWWLKRPFEARRRCFSVERDGTGVRVRYVPRQRWQIQSVGLVSHLFLFASLFWSLLEYELYKKHSSVGDLVKPMMMKRTRRWHWLVFYWCLGFLHMFSVLTVMPMCN
jgi:hypothetical protein